MGILELRALLFGVYIKATLFFETPTEQRQYVFVLGAQRTKADES